jgi:hypothetical protein
VKGKKETIWRAVFGELGICAGKGITADCTGTGMMPTDTTHPPKIIDPVFDVRYHPNLGFDRFDLVFPADRDSLIGGRRQKSPTKQMKSRSRREIRQDAADFLEFDVIRQFPSEESP